MAQPPTGDEQYEVVLQNQTYQMLDLRSRMHSDREFLTHYLKAAQQSAHERGTAANTMNQAAISELHARQQLGEELRAVQLELAIQSTAVRNSQGIGRQREAALNQLTNEFRIHIERHRELLVSQERSIRDLAASNVERQRQVATARQEALEEARVARLCLVHCEHAEAAHLQARTEVAERNELAAVAVEQALGKIEKDHAKERSVHATRQRTQNARIQELERMLGCGNLNERQPAFAADRSVARPMASPLFPLAALSSSSLSAFGASHSVGGINGFRDDIKSVNIGGLEHGSIDKDSKKAQEATLDPWEALNAAAAAASIANAEALASRGATVTVAATGPAPFAAAATAPAAGLFAEDSAGIQRAATDIDTVGPVDADASVHDGSASRSCAHSGDDGASLPSHGPPSVTAESGGGDAASSIGDGDPASLAVTGSGFSAFLSDTGHELQHRRRKSAALMLERLAANAAVPTHPRAGVILSDK
eukprot:TRINITY_DN25172_c0_g1_i1.p1 TRINITY_DN25172_c0_g1~~TRINITY_DN25172_c0_g1_i1.p1  ORF type:complete len:493 (+),score=105.31 TRINITY_DN25172_c0_g1_i1:35-1480(+)